MKLSARNVLKGTVRQLIPGAVNTEVVLELQGGEKITAIITKESAENLNLALGKTAYAIIKAQQVIVGVD
jgi:molybdopterin-binding protein